MKPEARRHLLRLCGVTVGMFLFGFALGPLYNMVCNATGINGRWQPMTANAAEPLAADPNRTVTVTFIATVNGGHGFKFAPEQPSIQVHPGQLYTVSFYAENTDAAAKVAQAVPNISPWNASRHLHKTECFCFNQQAFKADEGKHMPVRFMLDPALPASVDNVTLSYTFFDVTDRAQAQAGRQNPQS